MSKERLEELKKKRSLYEVSFVDDYASAIDDVTADFDLLIEQAELMQRLAKKNAELNVFLNKYSEPKHLGKNVIDVAMDIIEKQAERVQELEKIKDAKVALVNKGDEERRYVEQERMIELERQNKRYREALEYIADKPIERGTWTTQGIDCVFTARKALEDSK